jgi:hypothetical protein
MSRYQTPPAVRDHHYQKVPIRITTHGHPIDGFRHGPHPLVHLSLVLLGREWVSMVTWVMLTSITQVGLRHSGGADRLGCRTRDEGAPGRPHAVWLLAPGRT